MLNNNKFKSLAPELDTAKMNPSEKELESQTDKESETLFTVRNMAIAGGAAVLLVASGTVAYVYKDKLFGAGEVEVANNVVDQGRAGAVEFK